MQAGSGFFHAVRHVLAATCSLPLDISNLAGLFELVYGSCFDEPLDTTQLLAISSTFRNWMLACTAVQPDTLPTPTWSSCRSESTSSCFVDLCRLLLVCPSLHADPQLAVRLFNRLVVKLPTHADAITTLHSSREHGVFRSCSGVLNCGALLVSFSFLARRQLACVRRHEHVEKTAVQRLERMLDTTRKTFFSLRLLKSKSHLLARHLALLDVSAYLAAAILCGDPIHEEAKLLQQDMAGLHHELLLLRQSDRQRVLAMSSEHRLVASHESRHREAQQLQQVLSDVTHVIAQLSEWTAKSAFCVFSRSRGLLTCAAPLVDFGLVSCFVAQTWNILSLVEDVSSSDVLCCLHVLFAAPRDYSSTPDAIKTLAQVGEADLEHRSEVVRSLEDHLLRVTMRMCETAVLRDSRTAHKRWLAAFFACACGFQRVCSSEWTPLSLTSTWVQHASPTLRAFPLACRAAMAGQCVQTPAEALRTYIEALVAPALPFVYIKLLWAHVLKFCQVCTTERTC